VFYLRPFGQPPPRRVVVDVPPGGHVRRVEALSR
jgi:hypothetical protein